MALVVADRVKETTTTTGTGAVSLDGASSNFVAFSAALSNGDTTYYAIVDNGNGDFEVGLGTYTSGTDSLSRDTILASSNAGSAVNLSAGTKDVFITYPAEKAVYLDGSDVSNVPVAGLSDTTITSVGDNEVLAYNSGTSTWINQTAAEAGLATSAQGSLADSALQDGDTVSSLTITSADINGGTVDGTTIGGSSAGAGTFTTVTTTGAVTFGAEIVEEVYTLTGTTPALDPANGTIQTWTLSGNSSPTDSLASGESMTLLIDDGTAYTITWPTMEWIGGAAPTLDTSETTVVVLWKTGSTLQGSSPGAVS